MGQAGGCGLFTGIARRGLAWGAGQGRGRGGRAKGGGPVRLCGQPRLLAATRLPGRHPTCHFASAGVWEPQHSAARATAPEASRSGGVPPLPARPPAPADVLRLPAPSCPPAGSRQLRDGHLPCPGPGLRAPAHEGVRRARLRDEEFAQLMAEPERRRPCGRGRAGGRGAHSVGDAWTTRRGAAETHCKPFETIAHGPWLCRREHAVRRRLSGR